MTTLPFLAVIIKLVFLDGKLGNIIIYYLNVVKELGQALDYKLSGKELYGI
jgi:hypothetical protein